MFLCPQCNQGSLDIQAHIDISSSDLDQETAVQVVECESCQFLAPALFRESRAGGLGSESMHHYGVRVAAEKAVQLREQINACPDRRNEQCPCPSHVAISRVYEQTGEPVVGVDWKDHFWLKFVWRSGGK